MKGLLLLLFSLLLCVPAFAADEKTGAVKTQSTVSAAAAPLRTVTAPVIMDRPVRLTEYRKRLTHPVLKNLMTYQRLVYPSYQDGPEDKNLHVLMFLNPPMENILLMLKQNIMLVQYVPLKEQIYPYLLSLDP